MPLVDKVDRDLAPVLLVLVSPEHAWIEPQLACNIGNSACESVLAVDTRSAMQHVESGRVGAIILSSDLQSSEANGFDFCRELRVSGNSAPVVMLIARVSSGAVNPTVAAFQAGADDCLESPIDLRELAVRVDALMRRSGRPALFAGPIDSELPSPTISERTASFAKRYRLSRREHQVLLLLVSGVDSKAIGSRIGCDYATVRTHLKRLASKAGCSGRNDVVIRLFSAS